jgi:hypothetical protein
MFTQYSNSICYQVIVLFSVTSVHNWKTILRNIQKGTIIEVKHTVTYWGSIQDGSLFQLEKLSTLQFNTISDYPNVHVYPPRSLTRELL